MKKKDVLNLISDLTLKLVKERDAVYKEDSCFKRPIDYMHGEHTGLNRGLSYLGVLKELIQKYGK